MRGKQIPVAVKLFVAWGSDTAEFIQTLILAGFRGYGHSNVFDVLKLLLPFGQEKKKSLIIDA